MHVNQYSQTLARYEKTPYCPTITKTLELIISRTHTSLIIIRVIIIHHEHFRGLAFPNVSISRPRRCKESRTGSDKGVERSRRSVK